MVDFRWQVYVNGIQVQAHRIIWELLVGDIPTGLTIDHIDGDGLNNTIANLRLTTHAVNMKNKAKYATNKTGVTGVHLTSRGNYVAVWHSDGVKKQKSFSVEKYGGECALRLATECRNRSLALDTEYTKRHGR